ncbi:unnamed protein product [Schistocephalus solidus]|uniref:Uncharacterized protein n=1 Tax=Schistocephalus solidus TaxID=70667 RepID=A0A183T790_SCHSO|nr:unnamed protein product [Schistocephalus solidus]
MPSKVWWYAQGRLRLRQPPVPSPISGLLDSVLTPGSGGGGGESAVTATQGFFHLKLIHAQVTVPAPPDVGHTVDLVEIDGLTVIMYTLMRRQSLAHGPATGFLDTRLKVFHDLSLWHSLLPTDRRLRACLRRPRPGAPAATVGDLVADHRYWFLSELAPFVSIYALPEAAAEREARSRHQTSETGTSQVRASSRFRYEWLMTANKPQIATAVSLVIVTATIMPDLAGLDYVADCAPPRITTRGSRHGQFNPFSSPTTDAEYRRSKNNFQVLTNCVEPGFKLTSSLAAPIV